MKTKPRQKPKPKKKKSHAGILYVRGDPNMSAEQKRRYDELRAWLAQRRDEASKMTPAEREAEERDWQKFKQSINASRIEVGAAPVYDD